SSNDPFRFESRNATQPSGAFTTITGNTSVLLPSPFRSAAGTLPSGSSASCPAYHVVALVSRPIRPAPESLRPPTDTVPSPEGVTAGGRKLSGAGRIGRL